MIVIIIVVVLAVIAAVAFAVSRSKAARGSAPARRPGAAGPPTSSQPQPAASPRPAPAAPSRAASKADTAASPTPPPAAAAPPLPASAAPQASAPEPAAPEPAAPDAPSETSAREAEPDLSRFATAAGAKRPIEPPSARTEPKVPFRYPMEVAPVEPAPDAGVAPVEPEPAVSERIAWLGDSGAEVVTLPVADDAAGDADDDEPAFDLGRVVVAPLFGVDPDGDSQDGSDGGATVTHLEPRAQPDLTAAPLATLVADLIDAADPEIAEVMARLIDASDPELVAQLVDAEGLGVAEVVAKLMDSADPEVQALVTELADAPDRRQVAEVLRLVDASYTDVDAELPSDITDKLEELDIEADLELTSRPAEMAQFARLDNKDQLRVIIRVLCGLVAREDLPRSPRMPAQPASSAENRRWPLSRARWPVPPPEGEDIVKRAPLPGRRASSVAS